MMSNKGTCLINLLAILILSWLNSVEGYLFYCRELTLTHLTTHDFIKHMLFPHSLPRCTSNKYSFPFIGHFKGFHLISGTPISGKYFLVG